MIRGSILIREFQYPSDYGQVVELWREIEKGVRFSRSDTPEELKANGTSDWDLMGDIVSFGKKLS